MKNQLSTIQISSGSIIRAGLAGGLTGLLLISLLIFPLDHPRPEWGEFWRVRPLLLTPLVTALGAIAAYLVLKVGTHLGINGSLCIIIALLGFIFSLWIGTILGLAGTLWN